MKEVETAKFFSKNDPIYIWRVQSDKYERAREHYNRFPYDSVYSYGATDRLHHWYEILGEILGETPQGVAEVPEV